jgi:hypothetical protein
MKKHIILRRVNHTIPKELRNPRQSAFAKSAPFFGQKTKADEFINSTPFSAKKTQAPRPQNAAETLAKGLPHLCRHGGFSVPPMVTGEKPGAGLGLPMKA